MDGWAVVGESTFGAPTFSKGIVPCNLRLSSRYGVVNWRALLFTPSLLPLLSIDVTV